MYLSRLEALKTPFDVKEVGIKGEDCSNAIQISKLANQNVLSKTNWLVVVSLF